MEPYPPPHYVIPGMRVGCLPYHALIDGTLECFFSAACLNNTARWISSLPSDSWPKPLDSSAMKAFFPNTSVGSIFTGVPLDHWSEARNFSGYYSECLPVLCTFTAIQKKSVIYLITLLIGLYGGLNVALRIIAPLLIKFWRFTVRFSAQHCLRRRLCQKGIVLVGSLLVVIAMKLSGSSL